MVGETISHYKIIEKLGEGGMGIVYKAEDTKLKRTVALKFLKPETLGSEEQKARFVNEAQTAAALDHPNICTIHEIDEAEDEIFIVMAYIKGHSLKEKIESGPLKLQEALDIAIQVAQGLQEAQEKRIVHRDIKPSNIMLTPKGQVKIMDFGLAKLAEGTILTKAGTTLGTICYMSPQQARGEKVDNRTDIWSLGVVLYEMLTGQLAFRGEYEQAIVYSILNVDPEPVTSLRSGIPMELELVVKKCLEKEASDRYQHADELIVDLRRLKRDTSKVISRPAVEVAVPETQLTPAAQVAPAKRFVRQIGKSPFLYTGAALIILLVVLVYFFWRGKEVIPASPPLPRIINPTQVTDAIGLEDYPTWSPEGGRLAYQSNQSGNRDIWVSQVEGGSAVNLTSDYEGGDARPSWSPDGSQIAFFSVREGSGCFVMPALGGTPRKVTAAYSTVSSPCWSPDGTELAYRVSDSTGYLVEIFSMESGTAKRLRLPGKENESTGYDLSWSPDGDYFAYSTAFAPNSQLWIMRVSDEKGFPVTDGEMADWSPNWSQDGRNLYFVSNRGGSHDLWYQRLGDDGSPMDYPQQLTFGLEMRDAAISRDGKKLAFSKGRQMATLWRIPILDDRTATWADARQITSKQASPSNVDLSPDMKSLVFDLYSEGRTQLWTIPVEGGEMRQVTIDTMNQINPEWSPDGREIAFQSKASGNWDIWVMSVDGGPARRVTNHPANDGEAQWSPD